MNSRVLRRRFLEKSRARLRERLAELNRRFELEVRRLRDEVVAARTLRGEARWMPQTHINDEAQASRAAEAVRNLQQQENEEVKRLVAQAVRMSAKGEQVRELMADIEETESRIKAIEAELSSIMD